MVRAWGAAEIRRALEATAQSQGMVCRHLALLGIQEEIEGSVEPVPLRAAEAGARIDAGRPLVDAGLIPTSGQIRWAEGLLRDRPDAAPADAVTTYALRGLLRPWAQVLAPLVDEGRWLRPRCPVCGGAPDLALIAGPVRERRLLCARCDAEWAFARIGCPYCGTEEPQQLGYYPAGDGRPYRVYVCDACGSYLKAVDVARGIECCAPAMRVLATGLDQAAQHLGYALPQTT